MAGHHVGVQVQRKISLRTAYRCPKYDIIPCAKNQRTFTTLTPPHPILFHPTLTLPHSTPYPIPPHPTPVLVLGFDICYRLRKGTCPVAARKYLVLIAVHVGVLHQWLCAYSCVRQPGISIIQVLVIMHRVHWVRRPATQLCAKSVPRCIKIAVILGVVVIMAQSVSPLVWVHKLVWVVFLETTTRQNTGTIQQVVIRAHPEPRISVPKFGGSNPRLQHAKQWVLALKHYAEQKPVERLDI